MYRTMSLTKVALELGVSKPALYRHFRDKDALLEAMHCAFFDDFSGFIREGYNRAIHAGDKRTSYLIWLRTIAEYYALNRDFFTFSLIQVYSRRDRASLSNEFRSRGVDFGHPALIDDLPLSYPSKMQLGMATLIFNIAEFHHLDLKKHGPVSKADGIKSYLLEIERFITKGLCLDEASVNALNYRELEERARGLEYDDTETNVLLRAVAGAVAEAGPWNASMEMVARRSGLSKSGLYAHFKNKQEMIAKLFITEFTRIVNFAKARIESSEVSEEQLYLAIISVVNYLRSRPEILMAIDWIKTRRLDLGKDVPGYLYRVIGTIKLEAVRNYDRHMLVRIAQWMLFMIVNTLALWPQDKTQQAEISIEGDGDISWARNAAEIPNESFRILFRFIALGLEGL